MIKYRNEKGEVIIEINREDNVTERTLWEDVTECMSWENIQQEKGPTDKNMKFIATPHCKQMS